MRAADNKEMANRKVRMFKTRPRMTTAKSLLRPRCPKVQNLPTDRDPSFHPSNPIRLYYKFRTKLTGL